jgi:hypothetical protein
MRLHSQKKWLVLLLFICTVGISGIYLWDFSEQPAENKSNPHLSKEQIKTLRSGDILLREGYGLVSTTIADRLKGKYRFSHCGVLVDTDSGFQVIHTVSSSLSNIDGMQQCSLEEFVRQRVAFDHRFDAQDSSSLFCSELIWRGLIRGGGSDITKPHRQNTWGLYSFDMFLNEAFFEVVFFQKTPQN